MFCISEPNGTELRYLADPKNKIIPEIGDSFFGKSKPRKPLYYHAKRFAEESLGVTNTATGKISGQTHLQNQFIVFNPSEDRKGKSFTLFTANGTKRRYVNLEGQEKVKLPLGRGRIYLQYTYKLVSETLPNGHVIHYEWDCYNRLRGIRTSSKNPNRIFAFIHFPAHDPKHPPSECVLSGSDGRSLRYQRNEQKIGKKQKGFFLGQVFAPDMPVSGKRTASFSS